jgi:hypothetical protein
VTKLVSLLILGALLLPSCVVIKAKTHAPPGQVQKEPGYNPASGKVKKK